MNPAHKVVEMDRPFPQNTDAERAVLGAILMDNKALTVVRQILASEDFFLTQHVRLFREMVELVEHGTAADLITLVDKMANDGALESVGGAAYIASLVDGLPKICNVEFHAGIVKEKAGRRRILYAAAAIQKEAYDGELDIGTALDRADTSFRELRKYLPGSVRNFFDSWAEFEEAPPLTFSIEGFLQDYCATGVAGLSGHGKTWVALAIARALLFGPGTLWGLFRVPERAERVIYLIPESTRIAFKHRLQLMHLYDEIRTGRLLVRTLSKGATPLLCDSQLLREVKGAHIITDTAVRFMGAIDESSATEAAEGLSKDMLGLLYAEARTVIPLFHSPKSFLKDPAMSLEGMVRGSSEFGAVLATCWGIKQLELASNIIHMQNIKPRDFQPCEAFQIIGRPYIDSEGDFQVFKRPGECGKLSEEQPELNPANSQRHKSADDRAAIVAAWCSQDPNETVPEQVQKFADIGVDITERSVRRYREQARKRKNGLNSL